MFELNNKIINALKIGKTDKEESILATWHVSRNKLNYVGITKNLIGPSGTMPIIKVNLQSI